MGLFDPVAFKDITINKSYMKAHVRLSIFGGRFQKAQVWVDKEVMKRMAPYIPRKTGAFLNKIQTENASRAGTGKIVTAVPPQGKKLYPGITKSGKPFNWTNPQTQPYWGKYTAQTYKTELNAGVKRILEGRGE